MGRSLRVGAVVAGVLLAGGSLARTQEATEAGRVERVHVLGIPEPMVFDLPLALGALRGSVEASALVRIPLDGDGSMIPWTPEMEAAPWDGVGIEVEFPFRGDRWVGFEVGAQVTLGTLFSPRIAHGVQVRLEHDVDEGDDLVAFWVPGIRFDRTWSALGILGARQPLESQRRDDTELVAMAAVFADLRRVTVGVEVDSRATLRRDETLAVTPQFHFDVGRLAVQLGIRIAAEKDVPRTELVLRLGSSW